ncbi:TrkH family potassium uptake protein [uncultured Roseovarius sp.]|uniref:TrkH family potassium uptake protein n=1 Tax=uncultured Roseovarius sp. TaxID=293344 RepID=UPI0025929988|nr:TrkH family potassium uptake protein [uncultured Roseovarius sp.]
MLDLRPVGYVVGLLVATLGLTMFFPMLVDIAEGREHWPVFAESAILTILVGALVSVACHNRVADALNIQQAFLLTVGVWVILPAFGTLPFMLGETQASFTDAMFEAMSGLTTTGSTVFVGLDELPKGLLLWRGILQWLGGLGIVIVALAFLPVMRVGGMQFFRSEGFDTFGKVLPRTIDISKGVLNVYLALTLMCAVSYILLGLDPFEATVHALTTVSTGGFSTRDDSFAAFPGLPQYAGIVFMVLASMPFVRLMQGMRGDLKPFFADSQARAYFRWIVYACGAIVFYEFLVSETLSETAVRERLFNVVSIFSGTGYGDGDVTTWGGMPFVVLIIVGAIGGCTGSTGCSIKVFRYQLLFRAVGMQAARIFSPHKVTVLRHDGRAVGDDVLQSVILLFTTYILFFGLFSVALALTGLTMSDALTGAWTAIFNIGPAFGELVGPTGALNAYPSESKWIMIIAMLMGRLEVVAVVVLFMPVFWRD